jgi:hypothetical protein
METENSMSSLEAEVCSAAVLYSFTFVSSFLLFFKFLLKKPDFVLFKSLPDAC